VKSSHSRRRVRPPSLQRQIEALILHWRPILGLSGWMLEIRYDEQTLLGFCRAKPQYQTATIGFNLNRIATELRTPEAVEDLVVHELTHCVIWKSSERAVSQMAFSLLRAAGRKLP
jgi:hypothetical protein